MKKSMFFWILLALILLAVGVFVTIFILNSTPSRQYEYMTFKSQALKIDNNGNYEFTNSSVDWSVEKSEINTSIYFNHIINLLDSIEMQECKDSPTDAQIAEFSFWAGGNKLKTYAFAYDFLNNNLYAKDGEKWFSISKNEALDAIIVEYLDMALKYCNRWFGQSTFAHEEFIESDFENQTFRYNLYWKPTYLPTEDDAYRSDGFVNTAPDYIKSKEDAISRAALELGYENPIASVFYDETCSYWLVEIFDNSDELDFSSMTNELADQLYQKTFTVIMDDKGRTLEVYKGVTRFFAFV